MNPAALRDICVAAAEAGARVLRDLRDRPRDVRFKGRTDLVTDADKAAEEAVLRILRERAPGTKVLAEESGAQGEGDICFVVDPLDGTTNYAHGIPIFACTVGAEENGVVVAGCTVDPMRGETFVAGRGLGAELRSPLGHLPPQNREHLAEAVDWIQSCCPAFRGPASPEPLLLISCRLAFVIIQVSAHLVEVLAGSAERGAGELPDD